MFLPAFVADKQAVAEVCKFIGRRVDIGNSSNWGRYVLRNLPVGVQIKQSYCPEEYVFVDGCRLFRLESIKYFVNETRLFCLYNVVIFFFDSGN